MTSHPILIADIGGTNARFAFYSENHPYFTKIQSFKVKKFKQVKNAINSYLYSQKIKQLSGICLAVAGPIQNEKVSFTNNHWFIDSKNLSDYYNITQTKLINDWEAIAYSLKKLSANDLINIGGNWQKLPKGDFTVGAIGPGSGLGISGLLNRNNQLTPLVTEDGRIEFAPKNKIQNQIITILHQKFKNQVSREKLLSGPGIVNLHEALCKIHGQKNTELIAEDIMIAGINKTEPLCEQTVDLFFEILGQVAGDIALAFGATEGIFIGGGICQRYPQQLDQSRFREAFENKGIHSPSMKNIPTRLITHKNAGLLGASVYAQSIFNS